MSAFIHIHHELFPLDAVVIHRGQCSHAAFHFADCIGGLADIPFLGVSKKMSSALGMSAAVTFVMLMATAITYPIYQYLLTPFGLDYLRVVVFILIIALFVQIVEIILKRFVKPLYESLGVRCV